VALDYTQQYDAKVGHGAGVTLAAVCSGAGRSNGPTNRAGGGGDES
jgi:hypothetical protein